MCGSEDDVREKKDTGWVNNKYKCQDVRENMIILKLQKCVLCVLSKSNSRKR